MEHRCVGETQKKWRKKQTKKSPGHYSPAQQWNTGGEKENEEKKTEKHKKIRGQWPPAP